MNDDFRKLSKNPWWGDNNIDNINCGSLQRIADATEKMAGNYTELQNRVAYLERRLADEVQCSRRLVRSNNSLRGVITKLKRSRA